MKLESALKILLATLLATTLVAACSNKGDDDDDTVANDDDDVTTDDDDDVTTDDDDVTTNDDDDVTTDDDDDTTEPCGDGYCIDDEDCTSCPADCGACTDPANGCTDGTSEQIFGNTMVGCSASALWNESNGLCGAGWSICTGADWVARRGGTLPTFQYWTANLLNYDGGDGACSVSPDSGYGCGGYDAMLVCTDYTDELGNQCNWIGCGLGDTAANDSFGGCNNQSGAGAICCLDPTPPVAGDGICDVRELGDAEECPPVCGDGTCNEIGENCGNCPGDCGACCGNGTCDVGEENCLTCPGDCGADHCEPLCGDDQCDAPGESCDSCPNDCGDCCGDGVCDAGAENCATCPDDCSACCGNGACGSNDSCSICEADCGTCANPAAACSDGTMEQSFTGGMRGCAGKVNWNYADALCGPNHTACTAHQWIGWSGGAAPTHNYWTKDYLRYSGGSDSCSVSTDTGSNCGDLNPMRVCVDSHTDPEGNNCNWINCGYGTNEPNLYFGGCSGNMTAGTLCCPK